MKWATWENVGVGGNAPALSAELVVTLQEVNFCKGQIAITWLVRNNMEDESVSMPLTNARLSSLLRISWRRSVISGDPVTNPPPWMCRNTAST